MSRPRKKAAEPEEHHVDERWAVSYSDMVTVLMCLFLVLFAMSTVDQQKYEKLKSSLATGFGTEASENIDVSDGLVVPPDRVGEDGEMLTDTQLAAKEVEDLSTIQQKIQAALVEKGLEQTVRFAIDEQGLTVRLVSSDAFFGPDSANLQAQAIQVLDAVAAPIKESGRGTDVEGHTAAQPGNQPLRDWELSTDRAVNVVRHLTERGGVGKDLIGATGFAGNRPIAEGFAEDAMSQNRRVDIIVLSDESDAVKALIPEVAAEAEPAEKPAKEESGH